MHVYLSASASQQRGPFTKRKHASIFKRHEKKIKTYQLFVMAPAVSECSSVDSEGSEASPMSSPRVCRCQNQLAHWDWAGRLHPNLPECCRPANGKGPGDVAVDDGKISNV